MENLGVEIIDLIAGYVGDLTHDGTLVPYATISRSWQRAIEARTMRCIRLRFNDQVDDFKATFSTKSPHRRRALRELHLRTRLPTMSFTAEDCEENNRYFQDVVMTLFRELGSWAVGSDGNSGGGIGPLRITLEWETSCLSLPDPTGTGYPPINSFLTFPEGGCLAQVASLDMVSHLKTIGRRGITPHPKYLCRIASKMPSIEYLEMQTWGPTLTTGSLCLEHRQALAAGVLDFRKQLPNLVDLELRDEHGQELTNHSFQCPDITNEDGTDQLSEALRKLGKAGKLRSLRLFNIPVSSDLFRARMPPSEIDEEQSACSVWPSLRDLRITTGLFAANGECLYRSDRHPSHGPSSSTEESSDHIPPYPSHLRHRENPSRPPLPIYILKNPWSMSPDPKTFNPLVENMTQAVTQNMPSLERFCFSITPFQLAHRSVIIQCVDAGQDFIIKPGCELSIFCKWEEGGLRRFGVWECPGWRVPEAVIVLGKRYGRTMVARVKRLSSHRDRRSGKALNRGAVYDYAEH